MQSWALRVAAWRAQLSGARSGARPQQCLRSDALRGSLAPRSARFQLPVVSVALGEGSVRIDCVQIGALRAQVPPLADSCVGQVAEFKAARERRESRRRSGAVTVSHYGVLEDLVEETIAGACRFGNTYHVPQARKACEKLLEAMEVRALRVVAPWCLRDAIAQ